MTVVITGASKGIGLAIAEQFARTESQLQLAICSRNSEELDHARRRLQSLAPLAKIFTAICDVANEDSVKTFAKNVEAKFGAIDVLVNNAGYGLFKPVEEISELEFDGIVASNLRGPFLVTAAFLEGMRKRRSGSIVTISSLAGKNGFVGGGAYCASKFGVRGLMQSLFLEAREDNIRVITIFPGSVDTDFFATAHTGGMKSTKALSAEDVAACVVLALSLPTGATISELDLRPTNPKGT